LRKDALLVILSDLHSGGSTALFPNRFWQFKHKNHTPTKQQKKIYSHFEQSAGIARQERKGRQLIIVHDGDAIEGYHHMTEQTVTQNKAEQCQVHIDLMDTFMRAAQFGKGDKLYYVNGTETHTGDHEGSIAKDLGAEKNPRGGYVFDHLKLDINDRSFWFVHHGSKRGKGANEGNALRNFLRDVYWEAMKREQTPPDMIITGHTHTPSWNTYIVRQKSDFFVMHGVISPSWQAKTRYAYKAAPVDVNEIGAVLVKIRADGELSIPKFLLMNTE
jgi:predicted phosphodiesterase